VSFPIDLVTWFLSRDGVKTSQLQAGEGIDCYTKDLKGVVGDLDLVLRYYMFGFLVCKRWEI
jgi:hypothetical protein